MTVEKLIENNIENLSKNRYRIARYILDNPDRCAYIKAAALAENVGVSEATVVRFAASLGFSGYPELQKKLRDERNAHLNSMQRMELTRERMGKVGELEGVLRADIERIEKTLHLVSNEAFLGAVEALCMADTVYVAGVRSAAALAQFASFYFNILFKNVKRITGSTSEDMEELLIRANEKDVILGISFPRYSNAIVKGLKYASKKGVKVIALTDSENSPIVEGADLTLLAKSDMDSFADSLVAPMSIINALIFAAATIKKSEINGVFKELENIWSEYNVYEDR